jgi:opacity protein-like surface antigen
MKQPLLTLLLVISCAGSAFAQATSRPSSAPPATNTVGLRAYGVFDITAVAASKSFDAVFGSSQLFAGGGGAEIDVWHHLFLRIAVTYVQRHGSRVFVDDAGQVYPLNIPLTVTMTPIEAGAGWRFTPKNPNGRVTPYIGGAFVSLGYQETSTLAQASDAVNERYVGGEGFGGVDVAIAKHFFVGGEAQYRHIGVPDVSTSVMTQLGDKDLGGFTGRVLVGFRTK